MEVSKLAIEMASFFLSFFTSSIRVGVLLGLLLPLILLDFFRSLPLILKRNFTMIEKIGVVHLIKFYDSEGRKYLEVLE